ncbi:MAG: DNA polymerase I [Clostridia bacterium]|nr:DNA polymerase I [Clostridia bacterium]
MKQKILILDANSLFNRAFYGVRPLTNSRGLHTNAVFGFLNILKRHLDREKPDFAAAAFDVHAPTFRHKLDAAYKATRSPMPEELREQLPYLRRAVEALGIAVVEQEGYEADDILGTLSLRAATDGDEAVLVTGDRDSFQLVGDRVRLVLATNKEDDVITPEVIRERFGLTPGQLIYVKALAGDSSDNIPGVRGIGEKTAVKLIQTAGTLDGVYEDLERMPVGPAAKEKLAQDKEAAYRSLTLATICREVPGLDGIAPYRYEGVRKADMKALLTELEFARMLKSFDLEEDAPVLPPETPLQGTLFDQAPETQEAPLSEQDAGTLTDKEPLVVIQDGTFFAMTPAGAARLTGDVKGYLNACRPVVCDAKAYDHAFADAFGELPRQAASFDLFLAAYVLDSQDANMTLSRLYLKFVHQAPPFGWENSPARQLEMMEASFPLLKKSLEESPAKALYYDVELPLARVLVKMERAGFAVTRAGIEAYGVRLKEVIDKTEKEIYELAGGPFLIHSPKQLGQVLFERLGLPVIKKNKSGPSTDAETLGKLRFQSPIVDKILTYRAYTKLYSTYVLGLLHEIAPDGRIHTVFHQTLTATGRLSSAEPNLQNIPVKTELGREMRKFFIAPPGCVLADADYSQIELRLLAHVSGDETLIGFFKEGRDIHTRTASEIFHVPEEAVTPEMRKSAKAVNFGIVYGIGEYSLGQDLGIPTYLAKEYIAGYFALFPGVKTYLEQVKAEAKEAGYVTTLFGRRRYIPELSAPKKTLVAFGERVAMNAPIQGTAADIIKIAMVRVDRRLAEEGMKSRMILQVHDEIILECPEEEAERAAALLSEEMERAAALKVPLTAEAMIGASWFDAK